MTKKTPFVNKLRNTIDVLLVKNGFEMKYLQTQPSQPFESISYERLLPSLPNPDRISFHGLEPDYSHNYIYCTAVAGKKQLAWLPLRSLADNFIDLKHPDADRWTYDNEDELELILQEIANLLEHRLFKWFENPTMPSFDVPPIADRVAYIRRKIETYEEIARNLYAEGDVEGARRFEDEVKRYRKQLE